ncbi:ATP-binding protein [Sphingomonas profundi]|uniref:ATP-binding protein n=1 Tax=Alterirhizorhabdus profundi TaxID=2681549 RepID=UPI0012E86308|nr:ATP-binding protein [Sphingomonas profundi]
MSAPVPPRDARWRRWRGPPLAFQILGLLIGGLVVAQLVTLFLTMVLPPAPPSQYGLDDIAAVLRGEPAGGGLQRVVQAGPPDLSGPGWLVSERSRHELAALLRVEDRAVSLSFYTPLPFAGSALPPPRRRMADDGLVPALSATAVGADRFGGARLILAQAQAGPPPGAPPGRPPVQGGTIGSGPPPRDAFPPGIAPGGGRLGSEGHPREGRPGPIVGGAGMLPPRAGTLYQVDPTPLPGGGTYIPGDGGAAVPPLLQTPATVPPQATLPPTAQAGQFPGGGFQGGAFQGGGLQAGEGQFGQAPLRPGPPSQGPYGSGVFGRAAIGPGLLLGQPDTLSGPADRPAFRRLDPPAPLADTTPARQAQPEPPPPVSRAAPSPEAPPAAPAIDGPGTDGTAPGAVPPPTEPASGPPIAVTPPARGLFGFAPAPFVEGDFVAALRLGDGRWSVVQPAAEPFPNAWQRRLLLWFAVAFAIVAPLGWLFARRLVKPLAGFAAAAERLGRDPAGAVIALDGPAEMGRAARAFNLMQNRLRSFVDDRTAMVGAISHDLRTPLTRLRFRIEDVPDEQREGMLEEVAEMEAMISSVLDFIRDASTPNARERLDLRTLVDDVVEDAVMVGNDVRVEQGGSATVEVDVLGMRRVLDNLLENAVKYGARARVRLRTEPDLAVAEIIDDGPGLPEDELERVFEPFYRSEAALSSGAKGSGLGLAVCRSITRAHGGDVRLLRSSEGFVAQVRVPLAA